MSNRFQMTKFQKEVTEELEAKLAGLDGAEREERYSDTKTLVDDAFESDRISNFPLVGYTEQDSLKYILDNREEIMDVVQESAKEGTDIPMSDMLTNPNGFLISVYMEESKKLLSYSSLNEKSSFTVREALNVTANLETDVNMKRQMETDATDSRYGKTMNFLKEYDFTGQRRVSFEYTMFDGFNDSLRHADELVRLLSGIESRVNLIRFHKIPDFPYGTSSRETMEAFRDRLSKRGVTSTIRASRGEDILAACGMLAGKHNKNRADE